MSVYQRKYTVNGVTRKAKRYTVEFTAPDGRLIRKTTKLTNRRAAEAAELAMRQQAEGSHVGLADPAEARRKIDDQITEFVRHLRDELHRSADYCRIAESRLKILAKGAGWRTLADVTLASFEAWRRAWAEAGYRGKKSKPKTTNQYLDIARRFLGWAKRRGKVQHNPLQDAEKAAVVDNRNYRRAGTPEELAKLLEAVGKDTPRGQFYLWAVFVPLRRRTHEALTWADVHPDAERPWVAIRGETIKDKKYVSLPLRADVAGMLLERKAAENPKPTDRLWPDVPRARDIEADCRKAGIAFKDAKGLGRLDLHAFRKTAVAWMKRAGVSLADAALILQHKDIRTTQRYYSEEPDPMQSDVVEKMPGLPAGGGK